MQLPTQAQVNAAARHIASFAGGAIMVFGLSTKIDVNTVNQVIAATGTVVNDGILLVGLVGPLLAGYCASKSASPAAQAAAIGANLSTVVTPAPAGGATVTITDPAMATAALDAQKKAA